jgi:hypothetical protein
MDRLCCPYCGELIGVYEPALVIDEDANHLTGSMLTLRSELMTPGSSVVHERCYHDLGADPWKG